MRVLGVFIGQNWPFGFWPSL